MSRKLQKLFAVLFCFFVTVSNECIAGGTGISGYIYNISYENRVANASVTLKGMHGAVQVTQSDANGFYRFRNVSPGNYELLFSCIGYQTQLQKIAVKDLPLNISMFLDKITLDLPGVTVSPTIRETDQINVIGRIDKELRPTNSAQDLLMLVPGLFIAQHAGGGKAEQIFIRGFDVDHGTDFQISIDGLPVNMVSHAHGQGYADFHFVIPETVDELKVYKGPYNAKFGDFATAGAGEFSTKNSIDNSLLKIEAGRFNTFRGLLMLDLLGNKHLLSKEKENLYIAAEYVFTDSYFESPQNFNRYNLFLKYNGRITEKSSVNFSASAFNARWNASGQIPDRAVNSGRISRFGSIDDTEGGNTDRANVNLRFTTMLNNNAVVKNQFYYVNYNFNLWSNFTFFLEDSLKGDEINQNDRRNIYGYQGTFEQYGKFYSKKIRSVIGWGTRIDRANVQLSHSFRRKMESPIVSGDLHQQNAYLYLDETMNITSRLSLNGGLRMDHFDFRFRNDHHDTLSGKAQKLRLSPKLNTYYSVSRNAQLFLKSGIGFHSNDARDVVVNKKANTLPRAYGYEAGSTFKAGKNGLVNLAFYGIHMERELVYVGDAGETEEKGASRRIGVDLSIRYALLKNLYADVDVNLVRGRFTGLEEGENYIPLAPSFTSTGGISYKRSQGINAAVRYRFINDRPANESNTVVAQGYFIIDAVLSYTRSKYQLGLTIENLLNPEWNQAQFDTESRLRDEAAPVSELHFTPGTPFFIKGIASFKF